MNQRIIAFILCDLVLAGIAFGYLLLWHPEALFFCHAIDCLNEFISYGIARPLLWGIWPLAVLFFVLAFVPRKLFLSWAWFFLPAGFLALFAILEAEPFSHGFFPGPFPDRTEMTIYAVRLLVFGSALFLAIARLWKRTKGE